jgi:hypothetical protein
MTDWEVTVITDSNYIKKVRVDNCITRQDAEAQALGMTGAQRVSVSNPKTYKDDVDDEVDYSSHSPDGGDAAGFLVIGALFLVYMFWKFILLVGGIALIIWLIIKYLNRDTY